jgi:hypothetical protein
MILTRAIALAGSLSGMIGLPVRIWHFGYCLGKSNLWTRLSPNQGRSGPTDCVDHAIGEELSAQPSYKLPFIKIVLHQKANVH